MASFNWFRSQKKSVIVVDSLQETTREGINKAYIPKFLYKPPFGYPRFANMSYIRYLAQTPYVEMCIKTIIDELCSVEWDVVPTEGMEDQSDPVEIENIRNFFLNPNTNRESFEQVFIKMPVRDLLEVNSGILNKVYNMKEELVEVVARDGATFTKNPDVHGMYTDRDDIILPSNILMGATRTQEVNNPFQEITDHEAREKAAYFQYGWIAGPIPIPFGKKEIIWLEGMKRTDDHYGWSPVQTLAKSIQTLVYMIESDLDYYNDNNVPKGIIGLEDSDAEEMEAFKEQWFDNQRKKDEFGNMKKMMHKVPMINQKVKFERIEFSASELQIIEKSKLYTKMVWANFGVTAVELGYTDDSAGAANQIVQSKVFRKKAINPILRNLESNYNINIVSEFNYWGEIKTASGQKIKQPKYKFVFKKFDVDEEKGKFELYKLQTESGLKTVNEIRTAEGMEEVKWGDEPPSSFLSSPNSFNFGGGMPGDPKDPEEDFSGREEDAYNPADDDQEDVEEKGGQGSGKKPGSGRGPKTSKEKRIKKEFNKLSDTNKGHYGRLRERGATHEQSLNLVNSLVDRKALTDGKREVLNNFVADTTKTLNDADISQADLLEHASERAAAEGKAMAPPSPLILEEGERPTGHSKLDQAIKYVLKQNEDEIKKILGETIAKNTLNEVKDINGIIKKLKALLSVEGLKSLTSTIIRNNYMEGFDQAEKDLDMNMVPDQNAINYISDYTFDNIKGMNDDVEQKLRQVLQRGFMDGSSTEELKKEITQVFDVSATRVEAIARTETARAANFGRLHGYMKSGVDMKKVYSAHIDNRTSPLCKRLNGQEKGLDEEFVDPNGEWKGMTAPAHVNCRSTFIVKVVDPKK